MTKALNEAQMKTWYCVTTTFDDNGRVWAAITDSGKFSHEPKSTFRSTRTKDIYTDWFDSIEAAEQFMGEAKKA